MFLQDTIKTAQPGQALVGSLPIKLPEIQKRSHSQGGKLTGEVAIFETDACGFITFWSGKAEQVYQYGYEDIVGKHIASLYAVADLVHYKPINEMMAAEVQGSYHSFGWQKRYNGQEFWAYSECECLRDQNGRLLGYRKFVVETLPRLEEEKTG